MLSALHANLACSRHLRAIMAPLYVSMLAGWQALLLLCSGVGWVTPAAQHPQHLHCALQHDHDMPQLIDEVLDVECIHVTLPGTVKKGDNGTVQIQQDRVFVRLAEPSTIALCVHQAVLLH